MQEVSSLSLRGIQLEAARRVTPADAARQAYQERNAAFLARRLPPTPLLGQPEGTKSESAEVVAVIKAMLVAIAGGEAWSPTSTRERAIQAELHATILEAAIAREAARPPPQFHCDPEPPAATPVTVVPCAGETIGRLVEDSARRMLPPVATWKKDATPPADPVLRLASESAILSRLKAWDRGPVLDEIKRRAAALAAASAEQALADGDVERPPRHPAEMPAPPPVLIPIRDHILGGRDFPLPGASQITAEFLERHARGLRGEEPGTQAAVSIRIDPSSEGVEGVISSIDFLVPYEVL